MTEPKDPKKFSSSALVVAIANFRAGCVMGNAFVYNQEAWDRDKAIRAEFDLRFPRPE